MRSREQFSRPARVTRSSQSPERSSPLRKDPSATTLDPPSSRLRWPATNRSGRAPSPPPSPSSPARSLPPQLAFVAGPFAARFLSLLLVHHGENGKQGRWRTHKRASGCKHLCKHAH